MKAPKLWEDFGIRALLATIVALGYEIAILYAVIGRDFTFEQTIAILGISQPVALLGLRWYFEKKKEDA